MGWFENQIEERRDADQQLLEDSFVRIAGVVLGERTAQRISDERIITKIKTCDFQKYKSVYGTLDPVEQHVNKHIED